MGNRREVCFPSVCLAFVHNGRTRVPMVIPMRLEVRLSFCGYVLQDASGKLYLPIKDQHTPARAPPILQAYQAFILLLANAWAAPTEQLSTNKHASSLPVASSEQKASCTNGPARVACSLELTRVALNVFREANKSFITPIGNAGPRLLASNMNQAQIQMVVVGYAHSLINDDRSPSRPSHTT